MLGQVFPGLVQDLAAIVQHQHMGQHALDVMQPLGHDDRAVAQLHVVLEVLGVEFMEVLPLGRRRELVEDDQMRVRSQGHHHPQIGHLALGQFRQVMVDVDVVGFQHIQEILAVEPRIELLHHHGEKARRRPRRARGQRGDDRCVPRHQVPLGPGIAARQRQIAAARRLEIAAQQVAERGPARSLPAHQRDHRALLDLEVDIVQVIFVVAAMVPETQMLGAQQRQMLELQSRHFLLTVFQGAHACSLRSASIASAHMRPSRMAQTTSDCPRRMSPAA